MPDREALASAFVAASGWGDARRVFLAGDASARSYERLSRQGRSAVLMDAPPGQGEEIAPFVRIARHLQGLGLSAPAILAEDAANGFLLLEDLGDGVFARRLDDKPAMEPRLYAAAVDVLTRIQDHPAPEGLPNLTAVDWAEAAALVLDFYADPVEATTRDAFRAALAEAIGRHADGPRVLILRDYHAENLIWLPDRTGVARVGLLDFQLAQMGQPGYDLVSLCQDARRDVRPDREAALVRRFVEETGANAAAFGPAYAVLGAQRALRILGVFARLARVSEKPGYLRLLPRVWGQLQHNLGHPALGAVARICETILPPPDAATIRRIEGQCHPAR